MPTFGRRSCKEFATLHSDLQTILETAIENIDFSITEGLRPTARQQMLFKEGKTKCDGIKIKSKHQADDGISKAVDIAPYPLDYSNEVKARARFYFLQGYVKGVAEHLYDLGLIEHQIRQGADWDGDMDFGDQSFDDLPHLELIL